MRSVVISLFLTLRVSLRARTALQLEILALRHQLHVVNRSRSRRLPLTPADRVLWVWLSKLWDGWRDVIAIVKPETVLAWHRRGFRLFWTWKSRRRLGRPGVPSDVRHLIRTMAKANPLWGAPRIHGELLKLGIDVSQATVAKYMPRHRRPPSQTWRAFLTNHVGQIAAADFFVVPTATWRLLFVLVILAHERRRVVHLAVTAHPTALWTAQQFREAFPGDEVPRYLIRDRDSAFARLGPTATGMGIHEVLTAPRSPWQNAYAERLIGSIRRECLDHVIVLNEIGLSRILKQYLVYYHQSRTHLSSAKDSPQPRPIARPTIGPVIAIPQVGGLHHRYDRRGVDTLPFTARASVLERSAFVSRCTTEHSGQDSARARRRESYFGAAESTSPHTATVDRSSLSANRVLSRDRQGCVSVSQKAYSSRRSLRTPPTSSATSSFDKAWEEFFV